MTNKVSKFLLLALNALNHLSFIATFLICSLIDEGEFHQII